jgi:hypothetical protein
MLRAIRLRPAFEGGHEDAWLCLADNAPPLSKPSDKDARAFAVETVPHPSPAGFHKPFGFLSAHDMSSIYARIAAIAQNVSNV